MQYAETVNIFQIAASVFNKTVSVRANVNNRNF